MNLYYVKSDRYSGEEALAILAESPDEAAKKYRAEKVKRWNQWAEENPDDAKDEEADETIGSIIKECEIDVE